MDAIRFSHLDAALLYSIPRPGASLPEVVRYYTFINRDAAPPRDKLEECVSKAVQAGIIAVSAGGTIRVVDRWYEVIHQFDEQAPNEIEAMLLFEELLCSREWPRITDAVFSLPGKRL